LIFSIISVSKKPKEIFQKLITEYEKRIAHPNALNWIFINPANINQKTENKKFIEAENIIKFIPKSSYVISLDEGGKQLSSIDFSSSIEKINQSFNEITFIIGGADGLHENIIKASNLVLSLSSLTLPHQLVKIFLVEQLYRAILISKNHPYHRE
jgi:23S rRNA (pseudouridine1915-N3)-methyltransferase